MRGCSRRAFAEGGLGVRLDEIAAVAGVGVGTIYRQFKDKDALVFALFEQQIAEVVALADEALALPEEGAGLRWWLDRTFDAMATDRGLQQILTGPHAKAEALSELARREIKPRVTELLQRAHTAGRVRSDIVEGDIPVIQVLLSAIIDATGEIRPDLARRYAQLLLDALEPRREDRPLRASAPTTDEGVSVVENWRPSPRRPGARG